MRSINTGYGGQGSTANGNSPGSIAGEIPGGTTTLYALVVVVAIILIYYFVIRK